MRTRNANLSLVISSAMLSCATFSVATAGPQGGVITGGEGNITTPSANTTVVNQSSNVLNLNWQSFNVGAPETVTFQQPSSSSVAINRILDQNPSQIFGRIDANGRVVLLNPNGIVFGRTAQLNVGSLVASSLDLLNYDAAGNRFSFSSAGNAGAIVNEGSITANGGSVALLGARVTNDGFIVADYGTVALGAGNAATLDFFGDGLLRLQIDEAGAGAEVSNTGTLAADGGTVLLTAQAAQGVLANVVNNEGVIRANRIDDTGGVIRLLGPGGTVTNSGTLDASGVGGTGGSVSVLGERVGLLGNAVVDASGTTGGGTVLIGGDFQGSNPDVLNSQRTVVGSGAVINANASGNGDGGRVIVWSDGLTVFGGSINARSAAGNGGFAEVSGKGTLGFLGSVDLRAPNGTNGTLLLDPTTITIGADNDQDGELADGEILVGDADGGDVTFEISAGALEDALDGQNVLLEASTLIEFDAAVDATVNAMAGDLTLDAPTIDFGQNVSLAAGSDLVLISSTAITGMGGLSADSIAFNGMGTVGSGGTPLSTITQSYVFNKAGGDVFLSNPVSGLALQGTLGGALSLTAGGDITQGGAALSIGGAAVFNAGAGGAVDLDNAANDFASVAITAATDVDLVDANAIVLGNLNLGMNGALSVAAVGITQAGGSAITLGSGTGASFNGGAAAIDLSNAGNDFVAAVNLANTGANNVSVRDTNDLILGTMSVAAGALTAQAGGNLTQSVAITQTGTSVFTAGDDITLTNASNDFIGAVSLNTNGASNASIVDQNALLFGNSGLGSGTFSATAVGITQGGGTSITQAAGAGITTFNAGAGLITLDGANDFTGDVSLNNSGGNAVSINDINALQLGASLVGAGPLTATATGITQNGSIVQAGGGAVSFNGGAGVITLTNASNDFLGAVALNNSGNNNVAITDVNDIMLGISGVGSGTLTVNAVGINAPGAITQAGGAGAATFNAGAAAITLNAGNDFTGAVSLNNSGANNVSVNDVNALGLGASNVGGGLFTATAVGISQSGALVQNGGAGAGTTTFNAGAGAIALTQANDFTGAVSLNNSGANNVAITDTNTLNFGSVNIGSGTFTANAVGIAQTAAFTQVGGAGATTFNSGAGSILLTQNNDFTGDVSLNNSGASNAFITDINALTLGASNLGADLTVTTSGAIFNTGGVVVAGTTSLSVGAGNDVNLTNAGNNFGTVAIVTGEDVSITDSNAVNFATSAIDGTFVVNAMGAITDSGNVVAATGVTTLSAGAGNAITLDSAGNNFFELAIGSGGNATLVDLDSLRFNAVSIGGDLQVSTSGDITQNLGGLVIGGTSTFSARAQDDVSLVNAANNFTGAVNVTNGTDADFVSSNGINLGAINVGGHLIVTLPMGSITNSGALTIAGPTEFHANALGSSITVTNAGNNFGGTVLFASTGGLANVSVTDTSGLDLGLMSLSGNLVVNAAGIAQSGDLAVTGTTSLTAGTNDVSLTFLGNDFTGAISGTGDDFVIADANAVELGTITAMGLLAATAANGNITNTGALNAGSALFIAHTAGSSIFVDDAGNNFTGTVSFSGSGALDSVAVTDNSAFSLEALNLSGDLTVTAAGLAQSGALVVAGNTVLDGLGSDVTLSTAGNDFNTLSVTGGNVSLADSNALSLGNVDAGALTLAAAGDITQAGGTSISVAGAATFDADTLVLTAAGNDFGSLTANSVFDAFVTDTNALTVSSITAGGNVEVSAAGGSLTIGTVAAGGTVDLTSTGSIIDDLDPGSVTRITGSDITLAAVGSIGDSGANAEIDTDGSLLNISAGGDVFLRNAGSFGLSGFGAGGGNVFMAADGGTMTLNGTLAGLTNTAIVLENSAINQDIDYSAEPIGADGSNAVTVTSGRNLTVGTVNGTSVTLRAGATAGQSTSGNLAIGSVNASGAITTSAIGSITSTGVLAGTSFGATGGSLDVDTTVGTLTAATTGNLVVNETDGLTLGSVSSGGLLNLTTGGSVTQSGGTTVAVTGTSSFTATNGSSIALGNIGNSFGGSVSFLASSGALQNVAVNDLTALDLQALTLTGTLTATSALGITDSGALSIAGATTLTAGNSDIVLDSAGNNFSTLNIAAGNSATITDANAINLGTLALANTLTLNTAGNITDSGVVTVGLLNLAPGAANSIVLDSAGNNLGTVNVAGATNVSLVDGSALLLGTINASGDLNATAVTGSIDGQGALAVGGNSTFTANQAGSSITVNNAGNTFGGTVTFASTGGLSSVAVRDTTALDLQALSLTGNLTATAAGLTDSGALVVGGTTTLSAGANSVLFDSAANNFGTLSVLNASNVTLVDATGLTLAGVNATGTVGITAGGAIADDGDNATRISGTALTLAGTAIGAPGNVEQIDTTVATVNATASAGGIWINETDALNLTAAATGGPVNVTAGGDLTVTTLTGTAATLSSAALTLGSINVGTGAASLTATGALTDAATGTAVTAGTLTITAGSVGTSANRLDTAVSSLTGTTTGGLFVRDADALTLSATAGGALDVNNATGALTITSAAGSGVTLASAGALTATGAINAGSGAASLTSGNGGAMTFGAVNGASATINSAGALTLGNLSVGTGAATITAAGAITDGTTGTAITAGNLTITGSGVGTATNLLNTSIADLTATAPSGGIFISDANDLRVTSATANTGAVQLFAGSATAPGSLQIGTINAGTHTLLVASRDILAIAGGGQISTPLAELRAGIQGAAPTGRVGEIPRPLVFDTRLTELNLFLPALSTAQLDQPSIAPSFNGPAGVDPQLRTFIGSGNQALFSAAFGAIPGLNLQNVSGSFVNLEFGNIAASTFGARAQGGSDQILIIDWASFDPNISLFGTLNPAIRLPADQLEEDETAMNLGDPTEYTIVHTADGWKIVRAFRRVTWVQPQTRLN